MEAATQSSVSQQRSGLSLSPSVARLQRQYEGRGAVTAWELTRALLVEHPEYGNRRGAQLRQRAGPAEGSVRPFSDWLVGVTALLDAGAVGELHGRLLIVALTRLEPNLHQYLAADGFLDEIVAEIQEPLGQLFRPGMAERKGIRRLPDPAPLHLDHPALVDQLGRRGFARSLARRLSRIWNEHSNSGMPGSFMLHLHGPWGSGKSSMLNFLRLELQPERGRSEAGRKESRWIVVDFNAWQHQRLDPPWWPLMDTLFRQAREQLHDHFNEPWRARKLLLAETLWRALTTRRDFLMATLLLFAIALGSYSLLRLIHPSILAAGIRPLIENAERASGILTLLTALFSLALLVSRSLLPGSARSAQSFVESAADPMEQIRAHFRELVGIIQHPIIIFIDDLDRCQDSYVCNLLEGIQTLFNDPRVLYVVASDRRWIEHCFESIYRTFTDAMAEPGHHLGSLFLEKAFELSVPIPKVSPELQAMYWESLVRGAPGAFRQRWEEAEREASSRFAEGAADEEIFSALSTPEYDPVRRQAQRQVAIDRLATEEVESSTFYFLQPFAPLLAPNPRAMKRLLNAYSLNRDLAILAGVDIWSNINRRKQLVLWTILSLRWPELGAYLAGLSRGAPDAPSEEIRSLLEREEVRQVVRGEGVDASLDRETIRLLAAL